MKKNILYIEANQDGTIGGSHYCLLEIVKNIDTNKYNPIVYFYQDNNLVNEFQEYCKVIVEKKYQGLIIREKYPRLHSLAAKYWVIFQINGDISLLILLIYFQFFYSRLYFLRL